MTSISNRYSSNLFFYERHYRRASLLVHPAGLGLLESYAKEKNNPLDEHDSEFAKLLAKRLVTVVRRRETEISKILMEVIETEWCQSNHVHTSVLGEGNEEVTGEFSQSFVAGKADIVVRMCELGNLGTMKTDGVGSTGMKTKLAQLIIEVSVDKNGGGKKIGQALDYASLTEDPNETILLLSLHFDRKSRSDDGVCKDVLKITQEVFLYRHSEIEKERQMGFLWREVYNQSPEENDINFLAESCTGVVRCLNCTVSNREMKDVVAYMDPSSDWNVVSDNAVIYNNECVYKIFDNRFYRTYRRPTEWLTKNRPWIEALDVQEYFSLKESTNVESLETPEVHKLSGNKRARGLGKHTPYLRGSVLIIKYKYIHGTHYASQVSHFRDIALWISKMHASNTVHGDIRGFNMLHPFPNSDTGDEHGGIQNSLLIDFDFSGTPDQDLYPPVVDNALPRKGVAGEPMKKIDDWYDLGSVMAKYEIDRKLNNAKYVEQQTAWETLSQSLLSPDVDGSRANASFDNFINIHGNLRIQITWHARHAMENAIVGMGSPNKENQRPRFSLTVRKSVTG